MNIPFFNRPKTGPIMTTRHLAIAIAAFALSGVAPGLAHAESRQPAGKVAAVPQPPGPKIRLTAPVFDFGRIGAGTVVRHNYFFTNTGTAPLAITGVHTFCDCTTVGKWSARLGPEQSGTIPIQFDSAGYDGVVKKRIMVTTNDPARPKIVLTLEGTVSNPIGVSPSNVVFSLVTDTPASETKIVRITNNSREPLTLSAPKTTNRAFAVELKTVRPGRKFALHVTAVPPFGAGTAVDMITIKTNSTQVPVISVTALAVVQKPVTAWPAAIWLRDGPLPAAVRTRVTIRNHDEQAGFAVSDPVVHLPGVTAVVQTVRAGRVFDVLLTFPAGFELAPGAHAELRIKTTHPKFPVVTVPIRQSPSRSRMAASEKSKT